MGGTGFSGRDRQAVVFIVKSAHKIAGILCALP